MVTSSILCIPEFTN